ncbi:MAG: phytanoyl-CoA dioxygenase family protein [Bryobacterales bacterium]|nr:phytanoyl-CoA dioxygenase family protein [Bryobacterales bacterium]
MVHRPLGTLFSRTEGAVDRERYGLSAEQLAHFEEQGFVSGIRLCDEEQVDALREALARIADPGHPGNKLFHEFHSNESTNPDTVLFHALGAWRLEEAFHDLLWNPAFLIPASQILGGAVRFWHDQLFSKPARHGGVVAWHQDYSYWTRTVPIAHLTCWLALDDSTAENGCLQYVPGSHRWNLLPVTGLAGNMEEIMTVLSDEQKSAFHPVPIELRKGECAIHHSLLVHGSYENRSDRPRRATVVNVFRDGVTSSQDDAPLEGVPPVAVGEAMGGQFFPLLYDPAV